MSRLHLLLWAGLSFVPAVSLGQAPPAPSSTLQARCAQLVAYWDRYAGNKGEGGGSMDMPRKSAVADCAGGRPEAGIRTLEDLLRRNGYTVPPPP